MADRGEELWIAMAEMFGGPAIDTKYGATCPRTWRGAVSQLNEFEFARGLRRLQRFRRGVPSLPEFLNLCREVGSDEDPNTRPPAFRLTAPEDHTFDSWDQIANRKLHRHLNEQISANPRRYCPRLANGAIDLARTAQLIEPLLQHKRQWAAEMRESAAARQLPPSGDDSAWNDRMQRAEIWIDELLAKAAA